MTVRRTNLLLRTTAAVFGAASVVTLLTAAVLPVQSATPAIAYAGPRPLVGAEPKAASTQSFAAMFTRNFRSPLDGSAIVADQTAKSTDVASLSEVALDGTIGGVLAILRGPDGSEALGEIGDDVNGAVIVAIRPSEVDLRNADGSVITIRRPAESDGLSTPAPLP